MLSNTCGLNQPTQGGKFEPQASNCTALQRCQQIRISKFQIFTIFNNFSQVKISLRPLHQSYYIEVTVNLQRRISMTNSFETQISKKRTQISKKELNIFELN